MSNYRETKEWYERTAMYSAALGLGSGLSGIGAITFQGNSQKNLALQVVMTTMFYVGGSVGVAMLWTYYNEL